MTKSETQTADITALLKARVGVLWIITREEARVEACLIEAAQNAGHRTYTWDCASGVLNIDGTRRRPDLTEAEYADLGALLNQIDVDAKTGANRAAYVLRDAHTWLAGPIGAAPLRMLCNIARARPNMDKASAQAVIVITPNSEVPPELAGHVTVIEWPTPDREEISSILDKLLSDVGIEIVNGKRDAAIDAAIGLDGMQAAACFSKSLVTTRDLDAGQIMSEKKRIISREGALEWYSPIKGGLDAVGGLDVLKKWLMSRASAYSAAARAYGLPAPKGCLLVGVPGCGKSYIAKAMGAAWSVPVIRLDLNALKSKFVGGSEANLRRVLAIIEAIGRCIIWIDEVEKALQGATSGSADGGVSTDALGTVLSWMQERTGDAFIIATANSVEDLPPELLRKGRFDDIWFVDLPNKTERLDILQASLKQFNRTLDVPALLADATADFSGAEIAALVPDAMYSAFADGQRDITNQDLLTAAKAVVPASQTNKEKLAKLRAWASGRARFASTPDAVSAQPKLRSLDLS